MATTIAPTPDTTNPPKPPFDASAFVFISSAVVVADISSVTAFPTPAPTPFPTLEGYVVVPQEREVAVVLTDLTFPLTAAEAANPIMKLSLEAGVATSLGLDTELVTVTHIDGQPTRRRLATAAISFEIQSASSNTEQLQMLKDAITEAATEGSIVANVQKQASENGVLTADLQTMTRELIVPTFSESTKTITVYESTLAPPPTPADSSTTKSEESSSPVVIIVVVIVVLLLLAAGGMVMVKKSAPAAKVYAVNAGADTAAPSKVQATPDAAPDTGNTVQSFSRQDPASQVPVTGDLLLEGLNEYTAPHDRAET